MMRLANAPPGLFWFRGILGIKTEYKTESHSRPGIWQSDAYVVESGEYFWGGEPNPERRERLLVEPIASDAAHTLLKSQTSDDKI